MVDSNSKEPYHYHDWLLYKMRKEREEIQPDLQLDSNKHQESLDGRYGVDSNWIKGGSLYDFNEG